MRIKERHVAVLLPSTPWEVLYDNGGKAVGWFEVEGSPVEIELSFECRVNVLRTAKAVLLARKHDVGHRQPLGPKCRHHGFSLCWRHDAVFRPLQKYDWTA